MQGSPRQGQPKRNWIFPDSNARRSHRIARALYRPTLSFRLLKAQLERREYHGKDKLYGGVYEILTGLSVEMIETFFVDWMNQLQRLIDGNGDCGS
jgi:hypothetical protein